MRYKKAFDKLTENGHGAFVPFVTIGDPNLELSGEILETLALNGADALELGIPFSDPVADGPVIQEASVRALESGTTPRKCFELLKTFRNRHPDIPIGLLVYANLVYAGGMDNFYNQAKNAGVDSVLIADVPYFESKPFAKSAMDAKIEPVFIVPPNATREEAQKIGKISRGYTYVVARPGVTGSKKNVEIANKEIFEVLKNCNAPPSLTGFGISTPHHVKKVLAAGSFGAISGSAIVEIINRHLDYPEKMLDETGKFVSLMKNATL